MQTPIQSLQRNSDEGLQADQKCQAEHITAGSLREDVSNSQRPKRNDSALFSSVEPLDHTPPVTDEHSQKRTMQAGYYQWHFHASCPGLRAPCKRPQSPRFACNQPFQCRVASMRLPEGPHCRAYSMKQSTWDPLSHPATRSAWQHSEPWNALMAPPILS